LAVATILLPEAVPEEVLLPEDVLPEEPLGFQPYYNEPAALEDLQESGLPELRDLPLDTDSDEDDTL